MIYEDGYGDGYGYDYGDYNSWRDREITEKQKGLIELIEKVLKVEYSGTTRGSASDFISEYKEELERITGYTSRW